MRLSVSMTKQETLRGWLFLIAQLSVLPVFLQFLNEALPKPLNLSSLNFVMFAINFCLTVVIFRRFLIASAQVVAATVFRCLRYAALGLGVYYVASYLIWLLIGALYPNFSNANNDTIGYLASENYGLIVFGTVFLVPVAEETLYRGLVFQGLHSKSRLGAYALSATVFCLIHITGYIGKVSLPLLGLSFLQYVPAGLCLAWAYEKSDTIWTPILMHMTINLLSISSIG